MIERWLLLHPRRIALLVVPWLFFACASLSDRVAEHSASGEYDEARRLLDDASAADEPSAEVPPEVLAARGVFISQVEKHYLAKADALAAHDQLDRSCDVVRTGAALAPWSTELRNRLDEYPLVVGLLDALSTQRERR